MRAADNDSQHVILKALTDQGNSYRCRMKPADIIQQNLFERHERTPNKPVKLGALFKKLVGLKLKASGVDAVLR